MKILVVGGGRLVYFLARSLLAKGHRLVVVNKDARDCMRLARTLKATVVHGDGSTVEVLEDAGLGNCDAVLAVTPHDEDNFVICRIAALRFQVESAFAVVNDPDNEALFNELGITRTVSVTRLISRFIQQRSAFGTVSGLVSVGDNKAHISELVLGANVPVIGRALREISLPSGALIGVVLRNDQALIPNGDTVLAVGDRLSVITVPESYADAIYVLTGERSSWKLGADRSAE